MVEFNKTTLGNVEMVNPLYRRACVKIDAAMPLITIEDAISLGLGVLAGSIVVPERENNCIRFDIFSINNIKSGILTVSYDKDRLTLSHFSVHIDLPNEGKSAKIAYVKLGKTGTKHKKLGESYDHKGVIQFKDFTVFVCDFDFSILQNKRYTLGEVYAKVRYKKIYDVHNQMRRNLNSIQGVAIHNVEMQNVQYIANLNYIKQIVIPYTFTTIVNEPLVRTSILSVTDTTLFKTADEMKELQKYIGDAEGQGLLSSFVVNKYVNIVRSGNPLASDRIILIHLAYFLTLSILLSSNNTALRRRRIFKDMEESLRSRLYYKEAYL